MQHIITDEEVNNAEEVYQTCKGTHLASLRAAIAVVLANRPESTLGKLRPIAEMPETVPEGCVRLQGTIYSDNVLGAFTKSAHQMDTHAVDVFLQLPTPDPDPDPDPDPEAEERLRFEEAMKTKENPNWNFNRDKGSNKYRNPYTQCAFDGWMRCKGLAKAK